MTGIPPKAGRRRRFRWTAFPAGVAAGAAFFVVATALIYILLAPRLAHPWYDAEVISRGADISKGGGLNLALEGRGIGLKETCNGACDDVWLRTDVSEGGLDVKVFDAKGACVACSGGYVASGGPVTRFTVAGAPKLQVKVDIIDRPGAAVGPPAS